MRLELIYIIGKQRSYSEAGNQETHETKRKYGNRVRCSFDFYLLLNYSRTQTETHKMLLMITVKLTASTDQTDKMEILLLREPYINNPANESLHIKTSFTYLSIYFKHLTEAKRDAHMFCRKNSIFIIYKSSDFR